MKLVSIVFDKTTSEYKLYYKDEFQSTPPSRVATAKMDEKFIHFLFLLKHNIQ